MKALRRNKEQKGGKKNPPTERDTANHHTASINGSGSESGGKSLQILKSRGSDVTATQILKPELS